MFAAVIPLLTDVLPPVPAVIKPMEETNNSSIAIDKDGILISLRNRKLKVSMSPEKSKSKSLGRQSSRKSLLRKLRKYSSRRRYRRSIARGRRRRSRRISYRRRRSRRISYIRRYRRPSLRQRLRRYSARRSSGRFYNPLPGRIVTGRYGYRRYPRRGMHYGVDLTAPRGTPIKPASSGVVSYAGYQGGYGKTVVIKHGNGLSTKYAHMSRILVRRGTTVNRGTTIGRVGSTGFSTGPHLHFEFKVNNYPVNPYRYVRGF